MVYNKKGSPFVSDYKRDIFDKYTLIYWIQESYHLIFVFFSVESSVQNDNLKFFCKKNIGIVFVIIIIAVILFYLGLFVTA